jgi:hypothetical protein
VTSKKSEEKDKNADKKQQPKPKKKRPKRSTKRFKEQDLDIRRKLRSEIFKSRENLKNIIDELYEDGELMKINSVKRVIDELDIFSNEIGLAKTGFDGKAFADRKTVDEEIYRRVIHFNKYIFDKIENVTLSCEEIADMLIDDPDMDLSREMKKIKQYVTKARNEYKKRNDLLKEMKV